MKKGIFLFLALCLLLTGCAVQVPGNTEPSLSAETLPTGGQGELLYEQLFDLRNQIRLDIDMTTSEIAKMQADHDAYSSRGSKSPIYRMANLTVTITTPDGTITQHRIDQVGVRMKGNTSRTAFYDQGEGITDLIHLKLSFQETFDDPAYYGADCLKWSQEERQQRKDRTFATLEKIDIKWNRCDDSTYIKESYGYELYRENGVLAPRTNLTSVTWAGLHMGVYTLYEPVDKRFLEKRLPEDQLGGDLYKCGWTSEGATFTSVKSMGVEDEDKGEFFIYDLKTNKKTSNHEALTHLIETLNSGSVGKESLAELVDMENFLAYAAVSWFLGNPDDLRNNYNNVYLYFRPDGKLMVIPYDYDRCLGVTRHFNPTGHGMTADDPFSLNAEGAREQQRNPLFLYTVCQGGYYTREYAQVLRTLSQSPRLTDGCFEEAFQLAKGNYDRLTTPVKTFRNTQGLSLRFDLHKTSAFDANDNISFSEYLSAKQATLEKALKNADFQEDPQVPADLYIRGEFTGWEVRPGYALKKVGDVWEYTVSGSGRLRLKVYQQSIDQWYGTESVSEDTTVPFGSDGDRNINLEPGRYLIRFDPKTGLVTILPAV